MRCGIVGAGTMGSWYLQAFLQSNLAEVVAIADLDEERRSEFVAQAPGAQAYRSIDEMLASGSVEAVALALPDFAHREAAVAALDAGVHVLCEKPLAMSIADCDAISAAAERSSGMLMVNFGNRHRPAARILRDRVQRGDFGTTQILTVRGHEPATKTGALAWRARTDPTWFLVSHLVDFTLWLTEERIISVFGFGASGHPEQLTDVPGMNSVSYLASLERGGHAILTSTWILPEGYPRRGDFSCNLIGTGGAADVVFNELGLRFFRDTAEEISWDWDTPDFRGFRSGWWFTSCEYFLDCVTRGLQPSPSARDATEVTAVLCAMQHSLHTGQAVNVESFRSVQHETRAEVGPAT